MRKILTFFLTIAMLLSISFGMIAASPPEYIDHSGNYLGEFSIDPPIDCVVYFNNDGEITNSLTNHFINFDVSENGQYLSFTTSNLLVTSIFIKGGNGYRIYEWSEGIGSAKDLVSPLNGGGQIPRISHYGLGFIVIIKPTVTPTLSPTPKITPTPTPKTTPTVAPTPKVTPTPTPIVTPTITPIPSTTISPTPTSYNPETGDISNSNTYIFLLLTICSLAIIVSKKGKLCAFGMKK